MLTCRLYPQERDLKTFHEGLKQDMKLMKQSVDMMPKDVRKDMLRQRKEEKESEQAEKVMVKLFLLCHLAAAAANYVPLGEVKFRCAKSLRQKSKTHVWSKTQLKIELDLVTKTKNILRLNFGLRLLF